MEPVLIVTDTSHNDVAAVESFDMDLAYGLDEQDFEISFESPLLTGGELLYIDGTAYGGVVDIVETESHSTVTTYRGRTWHGILSGKIIAPAYDQDYVTVSGEANACIGQIIQRVGLSGLMSVSGASSGIQITSYQFARFVNAYDGLVSMLAASGAKLVMKRQNGTVELSAAPIRTISDEVDSDVLAFTQSVNHRVPNHLVCAGEGELDERVRLDLYADAQGNVSETQTLFGVDEIAVYYDYTGADLEQLRTEGTKTLRDFQVQGNIDADVEGAGDWDVGDVLTSTDNRIGRSVTAQIVKKIVKVSMGNLSTSYEVGLPTGTASTINNSTEGGGGMAYTAGDGIAITDGTISATGVFSGAISATGATITGPLSATSATVSGSVIADRIAKTGWGSTMDVVGTDNGAKIYSDKYASAERVAYIADMLISNSTSTYNGRTASLYIRTDGLQLYIPASGGASAATPWTLTLPSGTTNLKLQTTSLNLTTTNIGGGTKTVYFAKQGHIVIATFSGIFSPNAKDTLYNIGTIPSGYRPARVAYAFSRGEAENIVSNSAAAAEFIFNTNGTIQVTIGATGSHEYNFSTAWWIS